MLFWTIFNGVLFVINISSAINAINNNNINSFIFYLLLICINISAIYYCIKTERYINE